LILSKEPAKTITPMMMSVIVFSDFLANGKMAASMIVIMAGFIP